MGCSRSCCSRFIDTHTYTATLAGTKYLSILECRHALWYVNEYIAAVLHQVLLFLTEVTLTSTIYLLNSVQGVIGLVRAEVDKSIIQGRLVIAIFSVTSFIKVCTEVFILIVIHTVCTTKYLLHASLYIFHISRGIKHIRIRHLTAYGIVAQTTVEVGSVQNLSAQVVTAIYEVTNVRETVGSDIRLCMSEDIGITCSGEGVEDTSVT